MVSPEQVFWSPSAQKDLENISGYLMQNWGKKVVGSFLNRVNWLIEQIKNNPKQFPLIQTKMNIRKCVITRQNTLFYRMKKNQIEIIRVFDTRQDPGKLEILIK